MKKEYWISILFMMGIIFFTSSCEKEEEIVMEGEPMSDVNGNIYKTVIIGDQNWMAENLRVTHFNDDTAISSAETVLLSPLPGYHVHNNIGYNSKYGRLYNWYTVVTGKLCPTGWHVPTVDEWETLIDNLGGKNVAGGKMKESGFNAILNGFSSPDISQMITIHNLEYGGYYWSGDIKNDFLEQSWYFYIGGEGTTYINKSWDSWILYFSIRCLKDK